MKFLCTVILDDDLAKTMLDEDWAQMNAECRTHDSALMERGILIMAQALVGPASARTVRVRQGDALITDGPFMESKESLAGFLLIDVADADAAMDIARHVPMARLGAIEVRPVMTFA